MDVGITYGADGLLDEASFAVSLVYSVKQVGDVVAEPLQFIGATGQQLVLSLQFDLKRNLYVLLFQSRA